MNYLINNIHFLPLGQNITQYEDTQDHVEIECSNTHKSHYPNKIRS